MEEDFMPTAVNDAITTQEDTSIDINVLTNDVDTSGNPLSVTSVGPASNGTAIASPGSTAITYTPAENFNGTDTFTYTASNGTESATATVTVTINAVNDVPTAVEDMATTTEDTPVTINLLTNDSDTDDDAVLSIGTVGTPINGTVETGPDDASIIYTPAENFNGTDTFTYTVSDGTDTATAAVTVTIAPVNDPPVPADDTATTEEDTTVTISVLENDTDADEEGLGIATVGAAANGVVEIGPDLTTVIYTPAENFNGTDSFTYTVTDDLENTTATVTVTVNALNDVPSATDDTATTTEDTPVTINVLANDSDADDGALLNITTLGTPSMAPLKRDLMMPASFILLAKTSTALILSPTPSVTAPIPPPRL